METENENQQFGSIDWSKLLKPPILDTLFEEATSRVTLGKFDKARWSLQVLPTPAIHPSEENKELPAPDYELRRYNQPARPVQIQSREDLVKERTWAWGSKADRWFTENKLMVFEQKDRLKQQFKKGIDVLKRVKPLVVVTADELVEEWCKQNRNMTLATLSRLPITANLTTHFLAEVSERYLTIYGLTNSQNTSTKKSTKPAVPAPHSFVDLLANGFTKTDLDALLVHMLIKNKNGQTLPFKKYILHSVINALQKTDFLERTNQERDQKSLSVYLGIRVTRIKDGEGKDAFKAKEKAERYLSVLKKEREKNSSN